MVTDDVTCAYHERGRLRPEGVNEGEREVWMNVMCGWVWCVDVVSYHERGRLRPEGVSCEGDSTCTLRQ